MTIRPLATLKALRGIGGSYEQLCNERRISDLLEGMLEGMTEAMTEAQSGTMTCDEIKADHAADAANANRKRKAIT